MPQIITIDTPTLGDRSYLVHDGQAGLVIDPQRDIDRVLALARGHGVTIAAVFETHIHNDYVTGGYALAQATGADYHTNIADQIAFERVGVDDGDVVAVGAHLRVRVLSTPGHTHTHLAYAVEEDGRPVAVFTGGSLLDGSVGRPDLLGPQHTRALARAQYASAHRLARELPDHIALYPTHGFGSFCSSAPGETSGPTLGAQRLANPVLTLGEQAFVDDLLAGLDAWPAYYAHMAPANVAGPAAPDLSPVRRANAAELRERIAAGQWVVDLRGRVAFAAGHLSGTLNFGLDGGFATHLGWLLPRGAELALLGESPEQVAEAQRELVRIGIDRPAASATGSPAHWSGDQPLATIARATFADLAQVRHHRDVTVLDVRRDREWGAGHLSGALHVPLHQLPTRIGEVPAGDVWVHCAGGYRASIGASLLKAAGRRVVAVDDGFEHVHPADLQPRTREAV